MMNQPFYIISTAAHICWPRPPTGWPIAMIVGNNKKWHASVLSRYDVISFCHLYLLRHCHDIITEQNSICKREEAVGELISGMYTLTNITHTHTQNALARVKTEENVWKKISDKKTPNTNDVHLHHMISSILFCWHTATILASKNLSFNNLQPWPHINNVFQNMHLGASLVPMLINVTKGRGKYPRGEKWVGYARGCSEFQRVLLNHIHSRSGVNIQSFTFGCGAMPLVV